MEILEGTLKKISGIQSYLDTERINDDLGIQKLIETHLIIYDGKEDNLIEFPGIVYPDSIGNKVKLEIKNITGPSQMGTPSIWGHEYILKDLNLDRIYFARKKWKMR